MKTYTKVFINHSKEEILDKIKEISGMNNIMQEDKYINLLFMKKDIKKGTNNEIYGKGEVMKIPETNISLENRNVKVFNRDLRESEEYKKVVEACRSSFRFLEERILTIIRSMQKLKAEEEVTKEAIMKVYKSGFKKEMSYDEDLRVQEDSNNEYVVLDKNKNLKYKCFVPPENVKVRNHGINQLQNSQKQVDIATFNPPWGKIDIKDLREHWKGFIGVPILAIWTNNKNIQNVLGFFDQYEYGIFITIDAIKVKNNKLTGKKEEIFEESKTTLVVAVLRNYEKSLPAKINKDLLINYVFYEYKSDREKPIIVKKIMDKWFPSAKRKIDLYAENCDLLEGWTSVGVTLNEIKTIKSVYLDKKKIEKNYLTHFK